MIPRGPQEFSAPVHWLAFPVFYLTMALNYAVAALALAASLGLVVVSFLQRVTLGYKEWSLLLACFAVGGFCLWVGRGAGRGLRDLRSASLRIDGEALCMVDVSGHHHSLRLDEIVQLRVRKVAPRQYWWPVPRLYVTATSGAGLPISVPVRDLAAVTEVIRRGAGLTMAVQDDQWDTYSRGESAPEAGLT